MDQGYAKKDANPSRTTSLSTLVFGFVTEILCESLGIVSKNFSISLNWDEFICSKNSFNPLLELSMSYYGSSS